MRDISTLHPAVRGMALALKERALSQLGLRIIITECLRTDDEQRALYAQGRLSLQETNDLRKKAGMTPISEAQNKKIVTKAKTVADSFHGYGLAFDIAITDSTGKHIEWTDKSDWNDDDINDWLQVGELAVELGLEWGGQWTSMPDMPHYQFTFGKTIRALKSDPAVTCGKTICIENVLSDAMVAATEKYSGMLSVTPDVPDTLATLGLPENAVPLIDDTVVKNA